MWHICAVLNAGEYYYHSKHLNELMSETTPPSSEYNVNIPFFQYIANILQDLQSANTALPEWTCLEYMDILV